MSLQSTVENSEMTFGIRFSPVCRASVIIPARNEASSLVRTLDALRMQVDLNGCALDVESFEVLVLLNNCSDSSEAIVRSYQVAYPKMQIGLEICELGASVAHVGTARRMLMDVACERLERGGMGDAVILSTDADTVVAPDWIARNLEHVAAGAEVVGGVIHLLPDELDGLEKGLRLCYERDRELQAAVARLESLLDPDPADPWPRHLEHFGASLACTCAVYRRSGGLPAVRPLEDVAFVDALRKVGARIRHATDVHIYTSARLDGRAEVGLSGQLRHWREDHAQGRPQMVDSAEWIEHRFRSLHLLRLFNAGASLSPGIFPEPWLDRLFAARAQGLGDGRFLEVVDCDRLICETFCGERHDEITVVLSKLQDKISALDVPEHQA